MLNGMRKSVSGWAAKALLGLVVVAFVVTGFSSFFSGGAPDVVLTAGDTSVTVADYRLAYRQAEVEAAQRLGLDRRPTREEAITAGVDQRVLAQLSAAALLDEQGRRIGLGLSEERLARLIAEDPSFHDQSGRFSRGNFNELLSSVGMRENEFVENRSQEAVRTQIVDAIAQGAKAPRTIMQAFGIYNGERRTAEYLTLPVASVQPVAEPAADVLQTYFDANKPRYAAPEYRTVSYAALTPEAIADPAKVSDDAIKAEYERDAARFTTPERRRIEQIVYADKAAADAAKAELDGGKLFEQLVIESKRTLADTALGTLSKAEIPDPAVADAAFALQPNQVSGAVEGAFGPVLLRVTEIQPQTTKPLDAVKDEIRNSLALATATEAVQQAYNAYEEARGGGAPLDEAASRAGLVIKTIAAIDEAGNAPDGTAVADLPAREAFLKDVFEADVDLEMPPVTIPPSGFLFYEVTKLDPARDRTLDEVKQRVVADWKAGEAQRLLLERAEALKKRIEAGETLDQLVTAEKLEKRTATSITRQSGVGEVGEDGTRATFSGPEGVVAVASGADGAKLVVKVTEVAAPADPLSSFPTGQEGRLASMLENDFLQSYVNLLQTSEPVLTNPVAIRAAQSQPQ